MKVLTTFGRLQEFQAARAVLDGLGLPYAVLSPEPAYARVGVPCLVMEAETRMAMASHAAREFACAGWVDYRPAPRPVPSHSPAAPHPVPLPAEGGERVAEGRVRGSSEDVLGEVAVMVLAPCVADTSRIRLVAHIGGDLGPVLPYLNAEMPHAIYNPRLPALTYTDQYRAVTLYDRRITIAKADEMVDAWRVLDAVRLRAADVWARRGAIQPCHERRERPPVIEIFKRLPRTNCRACGEPTCLAFAARVQAGDRPVTECRQAFGGTHGHLRDGLLVIAGALGPAER